MRRWAYGWSNIGWWWTTAKQSSLWSFPFAFPAKSVLIVLPSENLMSHLPPQLAISASFLTSHFRLMIISVNYVSQAIFRPVRRCLTLTAKQLLVQALVLSRLDYCNALLLCLPQGHISRLQRVQNSATWLVTCTPCYDATSLAAYSAAHQVLTLAFQAVHCTAPSYLCTLVDRYRSKRELRSGRGAILLQQPRFKSTSWNRVFKIAVPKLWNSLPEGLRMIPNYTEFRKKLKTHLFHKAYQHLL